MTARAIEDPDVDRPRVRHYLGPIAWGLQQMRQLIEDLLDATRIGAGRFVVRPAPMDLTECALGVVEEQQATSPQHRFVVDAPPQLTGEWDAIRLRQVLVNLISNAVRYSPSGTEVRIRVQQSDDNVNIAVTDQGYGVPADKQAQLFEPFVRIGREREPTGTGLGLYITKPGFRRLSASNCGLTRGGHRTRPVVCIAQLVVPSVKFVLTNAATYLATPVSSFNSNKPARGKWVRNEGILGGRGRIRIRTYVLTDVI